MAAIKAGNMEEMLSYGFFYRRRCVAARRARDGGGTVGRARVHVRVRARARACMCVWCVRASAREQRTACVRHRGRCARWLESLSWRWHGARERRQERHASARPCTPTAPRARHTRSRREEMVGALARLPGRMVADVEAVLGVKFAPGYTPGLKFMAHLWEPLKAHWR
jgi:hypothetical protein